MPKELTHLMIARAVGEQLDGDVAPTVKAALRASPEAFLLGAIAHDGPFYLPHDTRMASLAAELHGKAGGDTYAPVERAIAFQAPIDRPSVAVAFAAGALSHMAADAVFHPAVFYFTGFESHSHPAVSRAWNYRHRAFEAAMDLVLRSDYGAGMEEKVQPLLARALARSDAKDFLAAVARFYAVPGRPCSEAQADHILGQAARTQALFSSTPWRLLARVLSATLTANYRDKSALFYTRSSRWNSHFISPRPYRDPISGASATFDVRERFANAVQVATAQLCTLERAVGGEPAAFPHPGPSLESGRPVHEDQLMRYCDPALEN